MRAWMLSLLVLSFFSGCLPASLNDGQPDAAVVYAAGHARPAGAADALDQTLRSSDLDFDFVRSQTLRFLEVRRGSRASLWAQSAASVGRAASADVVIVIRPVVLERTPRDRRQPPTSYWVELQLEVAVVDAEAGQVRSSVLGPHLTGVLYVDDPAAGLPDVRDDAVVAELAERSIDALAPYVIEDLKAWRRW